MRRGALRSSLFLPAVFAAALWTTLVIRHLEEDIDEIPPQLLTSPVAPTTLVLEASPASSSPAGDLRRNARTSSAASRRRATKSLAELGKMDEMNGNLLLLNRVPKSGAEVLVVLLEWLQGWNGFRHVRVRGNGKEASSRLQQEKLIDKITEEMKKHAVPMSFDGEMRFVNFTSFGQQSPTYVNLIRDPAESVVYRFYYEESKKTGSSAIDSVRVMELFKRCVKMKGKHCYFKSGRNYDLSIPYFCGNDKKCSKLNDDWALKTAKMNVERYYPVVGILDEFNSTLDALEQHLPQFFKSGKNLYHRDLLENYKEGKKKQIIISQEIRSYLKKVLVTEYEFYDWAKMRLFQQLKIS